MSDLNKSLRINGSYQPDLIDLAQIIIMSRFHNQSNLFCFFFKLYFLSLFSCELVELFQEILHCFYGTRNECGKSLQHYFHPIFNVIVASLPNNVSIVYFTLQCLDPLKSQTLLLSK